jgi:hypothetical protein
MTGRIIPWSLALPLALVLSVSCGGSDKKPTPPVVKPDLVIPEVTFEPASPTVGQPVTVRAVVRNDGNVASGATYVRITVDSLAVGSLVQIAALAASASDTIATSIGTPAAGTHEVRVCADVSSGANESNEENNCATGQVTVAPIVPPPARPDLVVESIVFDPSQPVAGEPVVATFRVKNNGIATGASSHAHLKLDGTTTCDALAFGELGTGVTADLQCSLGALGAGTHQVEACVDVLEEVLESDEANNCLGLSLEVRPAGGPNLPDIPSAPLQHAVDFCTSDATARSIQREVESQLESAELLSGTGRALLDSLRMAHWDDSGDGCHTGVDTLDACVMTYRVCEAGDGFDLTGTATGPCFGNAPVTDWRFAEGHVTADGHAGRVALHVSPEYPDSVVTHTWSMAGDGVAGEFHWYLGSEDPDHLAISMTFARGTDGSFDGHWEVTGLVKWDLQVTDDGRTGTWDLYTIDFLGGGGLLHMQTVAWEDCHGSQTTYLTNPPEQYSW